MRTTPNDPNDPTARMLHGHNWRSDELQRLARERLVSQSKKSEDMIPKTAVIYTRVSTKKQEKDGESLDYQIDRAMKYAASKGITVVDILKEGGKSAFHNRLEDRPQGAILHHMLFKSKEINTVIFLDVSRMFRNVGDACDFTSLLQQNKLDIHEVNANGELDLSDPSQWLGWMMRAVYAYYDSMCKQSRAKEENKRRIKTGRAHTSVCYGLDFSDRDNVKVDPVEANVIRHVFHLYLEEGYSMRDIAEICAANGARGAKGGKFGKGNVNRILQKVETYTEYGIIGDQAPRFTVSFKLLTSSNA